MLLYFKKIDLNVMVIAFVIGLWGSTCKCKWPRPCLYVINVCRMDRGSAMEG